MNRRRNDARTHALRSMLQRADSVLVADDVQRDILLGALAGLERVNETVYDGDHSLASLVDVADPEADRARTFCLRPVRAADAGAVESDAPAKRPGDMELAIRYLREGGPKEVLSRAQGRVNRLIHSGGRNRD